MKIYIKNFDHKLPVNILNYHQDDAGIFHVLVSILEQTHHFYLKSGRTKNFYSLDKVTWVTLNKNGHLPTIAVADQLFSIHIGFIPNQQKDEQEGALIAKMPGKVVKVLKKDGDQISKGEAVIIIEAMKMENEIKANTSGIIEKIHVVAGQNINSGDPLVVIQPTK